MPAAPTEADPELIRRAAAGDREAFDAFVVRHQAAVHRYIRSLVRSAPTAEDALQETFLAAWRAAATFRGEAARPWLLAIARHAAMRQFRRRVGEPADMTPLAVLGLRAGWGAAAEDPEALVARREQARVLRVALGRLDREDREVIVLRDLEGLSGEEAARLLGLGLPALKSRLHRARLRFAARVKEGARREG